MILAIDFGITNTDIVISNDDALNFFSFKTSLPIEESSILELLNRIKVNQKSIKTIGISGGKSSDFSENISGIKLVKVPEVEAIGRGAKRIFKKNDSMLVMSLGTGTACIFGDNKTYQYVGGIPVGGGTLAGLSKLLINEDSIGEISSLATSGDRSEVDVLIDDVVSGIDILKPNLSAANFAKVSENKYRKQDIAKALTNMIGEIIGTVAFSNAFIFQKDEVFFIGRTFLEPNIKAAINERLAIAGINGIYSDAPGKENCIGILDFLEENN
ncbi:MAG: pantothenate kinase [Gammaproteobacteria bacterium]|tara:strand:+ start:235 stop:1047 length:813 start_codon:yes stop_codon:yes gene_type:complete